MKRSSIRSSPVTSGITITYYGGYKVIPTGPPTSYNTHTKAIDLASWRPGGGGSFGNTLERERPAPAQGDQPLQRPWEARALLRPPGVTTSSTTNIGKIAAPGSRNSGLTTPSTAAPRPPAPWCAGNTTSHSPSKYLFRASGRLSDPQKNTAQNYSAYWVQDNWNLTDHFMLKLGLRLDQVHMKRGTTPSTSPTRYHPDTATPTARPRASTSTTSGLLASGSPGTWPTTARVNSTASMACITSASPTGWL